MQNVFHTTIAISNNIIYKHNCFIINIDQNILMTLRIKKMNSDKIREYLDSLDVQPKKYHVGTLTSKPYFSNLSQQAKTLKNIQKIQIPQSPMITAIKQKIINLYLKLVVFYETNQNKLVGMIKAQLFDKNYLHGREILQFIKNIRQDKIVKLSKNPFEKLLYDLQNFAVFLESFYQTKCLKQIEIIQQSILQRQLVVRNATDYNSYQLISKNVRPALLGDYNIYEQFKNISDKYGNFKQISNVQRALYQRMHQSQKKILKIFEEANILKEKDKFLFKRKPNIAL